MSIPQSHYLFTSWTGCNSIPPIDRYTLHSMNNIWLASPQALSMHRARCNTCSLAAPKYLPIRSRDFWEPTYFLSKMAVLGKGDSPGINRGKLDFGVQCFSHPRTERYSLGSIPRYCFLCIISYIYMIMYNMLYYNREVQYMYLSVYSNWHQFIALYSAILPLFFFQGHLAQCLYLHACICAQGFAYRWPSLSSLK